MIFYKEQAIWRGTAHLNVHASQGGQRAVWETASSHTLEHQRLERVSPMVDRRRSPAWESVFAQGLECARVKRVQSRVNEGMDAGET